jgi:hypothetical protein
VLADQIRTRFLHLREMQTIDPRWFSGSYTLLPSAFFSILTILFPSSEMLLARVS